MVLVIIGTMLTLGLAAFNAQMTTGAYAKTRAKLDVIKSALIDHLGRHMYLPCPDQDVTDPDGTGEDVDTPDDRVTPGDTSSNCSVNWGILPYRDLGLPREAALDAWDNYFTYHVTADGTQRRRRWVTRDTLLAGHEGALKVRDTSVGGGIEIESDVAAIVVSHGLNGLGAYTVKGVQNAMPLAATAPDEVQNTDGDLTYVRRDYSEKNDAATGGKGLYDDLVLSVSAKELLGSLARNGVMPPLQAALLAAFEDAEEYLLGGTASGYHSGHKSDSDCTFDLPISLPARLDPWGNLLQYKVVVGGGRIICDSTVTGDAYTISSAGPDGVFGNIDDASRSRTNSSICLKVLDLCPP